MAKELKNEIKYSIQLCAEQKEAKRLILENEIVIITGNAGVGKSSVIAQSALDLKFKRLIDTIFLGRPAKEVGSSLGFLPGDLNSKLQPYNESLVQSMKDCYRDTIKIDKLVEENFIQNLPIQFVRSKNIKERQLYVIDECQNTTAKEMEAILTRASGGKIVLLGDLRQCDIKGKSGLEFAIELSKNIEEIKHIHLKENHRSGVVKKIIDYIYGIEV